VEKIMLNTMYTIPSRKDVKECLITKDVVVKGADPVFVDVKKAARKEAG